jgi:hypothetical protein
MDRNEGVADRVGYAHEVEAVAVEVPECLPETTVSRNAALPAPTAIAGGKQRCRRSHEK